MKKRGRFNACEEKRRLLLRGSSLGGGVGVLLRESLDAAGGVDKLLFASEKGMATRANFHSQRVAFYGRTRRESVPAGAMHGNSVIVGVNTGFQWVSNPSRPVCTALSNPAASLGREAVGIIPEASNVRQSRRI
jgi:hypothetical protein